MKILHISPSYYPAVQFGGPIRSVHALNLALVGEGAQVTVMTTNAGLRNRTDIPSATPLITEGIPVTYYPYRGYEHYNFSLSFLRAVFREVPKYDVVHITAVWNFPVLAAGLACLWHGKPFVLSPRGTLYAETIAHRSAFIKRLYYRLVAGIPVRRASLLHFTTHDEASQVRSLFNLKNPFVVIPNGIDLKISDQAAPVEHPEWNGMDYLLFLGRIDRKKGLDILLPAFATVVKKYPKLKLMIAGPDNEGYGETVRNLASTLGISHALVFPGMLEGAAKWNAYRRARGFVLTSYSENFGMTVAEAMACHCPVVISDKVALAEFIRDADAGYICTTTVESATEHILNLLDSPEQAREKAQKARHIAEESFEIRQVARQFLKAYQQLIPTHAR